MKTKTEAICPICLQTVPAYKEKVGKDVFLHKDCPQHGHFVTQIAKDAKRFFDKTFDVKGKEFTPVCTYNGNCGADCGWCNKHRQHICTGLIEITESCNMACPICYFGQKSSQHISVDEFKNRLATLLTVENQKLDVLQISGGECLLHPNLLAMLDIALCYNIGRILINTNGLNLLTDERIFQYLKGHRDRIEVYLQFDGFDDKVYQTLRGRKLLAEKEAIIAKLNAAEIKMCLAVTVYQNNLAQIPQIMELAIRTKHISGITFQRLTKVGSALDSQVPTVMQEDILLAMAQSGYMRYQDIIPLPCSHENCTSLGFLFCQGDKVYSLGDYIDFTKCKQQISNRIAFDKTILEYMRHNVCDCFVGRIFGSTEILQKLKDFANGDGSCHKDMKIIRIVVKNFMDIDNFDWERARKCCTGVAVGNGKVVPFCVHNALKGKISW